MAGSFKIKHEVGFFFFFFCGTIMEKLKELKRFIWMVKEKARDEMEEIMVKMRVNFFG